MLLTAKTILYVTSKDGTNEMSFLDFSNAIKGGLDLEEVEITTDAEHSQRLERKRRAKHEVQHLMNNMTPEQAEKVVEMLRDNEELMELLDDYA
jgi:antitoxin component of MazEF toxin-antitoxin module